ncbi:hypothetical protein TNCV_2204381 [Trichonephila clavipes]|nr:hypothetical protein TNCV_2204381 [Trichonephila clavipes]
MEESDDGGLRSGLVTLIQILKQYSCLLLFSSSSPQLREAPQGRFLTAKNVSAAEIHEQISDVYGPNAMSSNLLEWADVFKDGGRNVHDEPQCDKTSHRREGVSDQYLEETMSGGRDWVCHITPDSKRQSMEWSHRNSSHTHLESRPSRNQPTNIMENVFGGHGCC